MKDLQEIIDKYRLKIAYRGVVNPEEGITAGITPNKDDLEFIKSNKKEIMQLLKAKRKLENEIKSKEYKEKKDADLKERYYKEFDKAERENVNVKLDSWEEPCNDDKEECNLDYVTRFVRPDGSTYTNRQHTW